MATHRPRSTTAATPDATSTATPAPAPPDAAPAPQSPLQPADLQKQPPFKDPFARAPLTRPG